MTKLQKYDQIKKVAVEHFATNPGLTVKELAIELGVTERTISAVGHANTLFYPRQFCSRGGVDDKSDYADRSNRHHGPAAVASHGPQLLYHNESD